MFGFKKKDKLSMDGSRVADLMQIRKIKTEPLRGKNEKINNISARLGVISNQLSKLIEDSKEAKKMGAPDIRRKLYKARRSIQTAIENIKK